MSFISAPGGEVANASICVGLVLSKGGGPHQPGQSHSGSAASGDADSLVSGGTPRSKTQILTVWDAMPP